MNTLSLRTAAVVSLLLHVLLFLTASVAFRNTTRLKLPEVYSVKVVTTGGKKGGPPGIRQIKRIKERRRKILSKKKAVVVEKEVRETVRKGVKEPVKEERPLVSVEEEIALLKAKKEIEERVKLKRQVLVSLEEIGGTGGAEMTVEDAYWAEVRQRIWQEWVVPEFLIKEGLEAVISIRVKRDGTVEILEVESSSGEPLFDRAAIRALQKASPLPPPPRQMDITVRFTP